MERWLQLRWHYLLGLLTGFPLVGGGVRIWKHWLVPPCLPPLFCPQNVDFLISCSFWSFSPNFPHLSWPHLGNTDWYHYWYQIKDLDKGSLECTIWLGWYNTRRDQARDEKVVSRVKEAEPLQSRKTCKGRQRAAWSQCIHSYRYASEAAHGAAVYPVVQHQDGYIS